MYICCEALRDSGELNPRSSATKNQFIWKLNHAALATCCSSLWSRNFLSLPPNFVRMSITCPSLLLNFGHPWAGLVPCSGTWLSADVAVLGLWLDSSNDLKDLFQPKWLYKRGFSLVWVDHTDIFYCCPFLGYRTYVCFHPSSFPKILFLWKCNYWKCMWGAVLSKYVFMWRWLFFTAICFK